jgi:hypothetical protein
MLQKIAKGTLDPDASRVQRLDIEIEHSRTCDDLDDDHQTVVYGPEQQQVADVDEILPTLEMDDKVEDVCRPMTKSSSRQHMLMAD